MKKIDSGTALVIALLVLIVLWVLSNPVGVAHMLNTMSAIGK